MSAEYSVEDVRDGWVLVPIKQTPEMESEGAESLLCGPGGADDWRHATAALVWSAMVSKAPRYTP
jgi:hypothetical protein